jgi:hypothetical protein
VTTRAYVDRCRPQVSGLAGGQSFARPNHGHLAASGHPTAAIAGAIGSLPTGDLDGGVPKKAVKAEIQRMVKSIRFER